ncbi:hypothetical protein H0H81_012511 [Sphagnurus paluster]|uniref:Uncharacterized protein n=1 Tax=Sphagnurus paluster TaxID=117069 RepID=A0A9P7GGS6_9AGAR|nr:hypothetical protein H0H81_012511 [Sphagnurus paluster]
MKKVKIEKDLEIRGDEALGELAASDTLLLLAAGKDTIVEEVGGKEVWDGLSIEEQERRLEAVMPRVQQSLGQAAFDALPAVEKASVQLCLRGGCAMHKDLNGLKGFADGMAQA